MAPVGQACLILALATCGYGIGASLYGALTGRRDWIDSGRRSVENRHRRIMRQATRSDEQHPPVELSSRLAHRGAERANATDRTQGSGHPVDEDGHNRDAVDAAKQRFQRLGESMVDGHPGRDCQVHPTVQHPLS